MLQSKDNESLREWEDSAPYWEKHAGTIRTMFAPVTASLIEEAGIVAGHKVLDVAGGAGEPSLTIAQVVAPPRKIAPDGACAMADGANAAANKQKIRDEFFLGLNTMSSAYGWRCPANGSIRAHARAGKKVPSI